MKDKVSEDVTILINDRKIPVCDDVEKDFWEFLWETIVKNSQTAYFAGLAVAEDDPARIEVLNNALMNSFNELARIFAIPTGFLPTLKEKQDLLSVKSWELKDE